MRILVTGGFGYLGGRIAQSLSSKGHKIVLGSRKKQYPPKWLPDAKVVQIEWDNSECLLAVCEEIDVIVHAAGMNAKDCLLDPEGAIKFNAKSTYTFLLLFSSGGRFSNNSSIVLPNNLFVLS